MKNVIGWRKMNKVLGMFPERKELKKHKKQRIQGEF
jgi:hypothetical protein